MATMDSVPNEILLYLFAKLDGFSLAHASGVCYRWRELSKGLWRQKCEREIEAPDLKEILSKTWGDLDTKTWRDIYKCWYISTHQPDRWALGDRQQLLQVPTQVEALKIYKEYLIFSDMTQIYLYSLKTKTPRLLCIWKFYGFVYSINSFELIDLDGTVYLIFNGLNKSVFNTLKIENEIFRYCHPISFPNEMKYSHGTDLRSYNNYIAFLRYKQDDTLVIKAVLHPSRHDTLTFDIIGAVEAKGPYYSLQAKDKFEFWNDLFVVYTKRNIRMYSYTGAELTLTKAFSMSSFFAPDCYATFSSTCFFVYGLRSIYRISKTGNDYELTDKVHPTGLRFAHYLGRGFCNMLISAYPLNPDVFNIYKVAEAMEIVTGNKDEHPTKGTCNYEACFQDGNLVIVYGAENTIMLQTLSTS